MGPAFSRKYATATASGTHVYLQHLKAGSNDYATSSDWTPASGDVQVSKDGAAFANITTLPAYTNGQWVYQFSSGELTCKTLLVRIVDSATKAVNDDAFLIETFGHSSALFPVDFSDVVRMGLTALPNAASGSAGAVLTAGTGTAQLNVSSGRAQADVTHYGGSAGTFSGGRPEVNASHWGGTAVASAVVSANAVQFSGSATAADNAEAVFDTYFGNAFSTFNQQWNTGASPAASVTGSIGGLDSQAQAHVRDALGMSAEDLDDQLDAISAKLPASLTAGGNMKADALALGGSTAALANLAAAWAGLITGTAQAGGASSITLAAGASATDDFYNDMAVYVVSGTGAGQTNRVLDYDGTTKVATVEKTWGTNPSSDSVYQILGYVA